MDKNMKKIWIGIGIVVVVALAIVLVAIQTKKEPEEIKIGWIGPLTGDLAYYAQMIKKATDLAVEEINGAGGINGMRLNVIYHDDGLDPKKGVSAFLKLTTTDKVPLIIQAAGSSIMLAEAPLAEKHKVVLITPTCSNPKIKFAGDYIFRVWPSDAYQGVSIAEFIFSNLKKTQASVLYLNNDYGIGVKEEFVRKFKELGGTILAIEGFEQGASDFRTQLTKIKSQNPQVVFLSSHYKEGALLVKQAKELGIKSQIIASDACYAPEFLRLSGGAAEGVIVANLYWNPNSEEPIIRTFVDRFKKRYGEQPEVYAAAGYDCLKVIAVGMKNGGIASEGIKKALYRIKGFKGVTGDITFDEYGEIAKSYDLFVVKAGEFEPYK